jgi:hypothetical protein
MRIESGRHLITALRTNGPNVLMNYKAEELKFAEGTGDGGTVWQIEDIGTIQAGHARDGRHGPADQQLGADEVRR